MLDETPTNELSLTDFSLYTIGLILCSMKKEEMYDVFVDDILINAHFKLWLNGIWIFMMLIRWQFVKHIIVHWYVMTTTLIELKLDGQCLNRSGIRSNQIRKNYFFCFFRTRRACRP